jgi:hypothetical protein
VRTQDVVPGQRYMCTQPDVHGVACAAREVVAVSKRPDGKVLVSFLGTTMWVDPAVRLTPAPVADGVTDAHRAEVDVMALAAWVLRTQDDDRRSGRELVLAALVEAGRRGLTDHEHESRNGLIPTSAGKRRGELRDRRLVENAGTKRPTQTGERATVWRVTDLGAAVWQIIDRDRRGAA